MLLSTAPNHGPKASLLEFGFINPCYDMVHTQHLIGRSNQIKVIVIYLNWWRIKLLICVICELWICGYGWWWLSYTNVMQYFLNYILSLGWWVQYKIFWNPRKRSSSAEVEWFNNVLRKYWHMFYTSLYISVEMSCTKVDVLNQFLCIEGLISPSRKNSPIFLSFKFCMYIF